MGWQQVPAGPKRQPGQCPRCVLDPFWLQRPNIVVCPRFPVCLAFRALLRGIFGWGGSKCQPAPSANQDSGLRGNMFKEWNRFGGLTGFGRLTG